MRRSFNLLALLFAASMAFPATGLAVPPPLGGISQLPGTDGCVSDDGTGGQCADGFVLQTAMDAAVSADGKNVYALDQFADDAIAIFSRNSATGALTETGCISWVGDSPPACPTTARGLNAPTGVAVSPDGKNVYVVSRESGSITTFSRGAGTGALQQLTGNDGCISDTGSGPPDDCFDGRNLMYAEGVAVSADGKNVYVASSFGPTGNSLTTFSRNTLTGVLTQPGGTSGCVHEGSADPDCGHADGLSGARSVAVAPDGNGVYVASSTSNAVAAFFRDSSTGVLTAAGCIYQGGPDSCTVGNALNAARWVAVSPDGANVYVTSYLSKAVAIFSRNAGSGALSQIGCISQGGTEGCDSGKALNGVQDVAVSPDGKNVFAASETSGAVAVFARNAANGSLAQLSGANGCISDDGTGGACTDGVALQSATGIAVSPGGDSVYAASYASDAVAVFTREAAPVCTSTAGAVAHNTTTAIALACSDPNGDPITLLIVAAPANGTLGDIDQAGDTVTYIPGPGFSGSDTFTFRASDGAEVSNTATVSLTVLGGAPAPADTTPPSVTIPRRVLRLGKRGTVDVRLSCPAEEPDGSCAGRLTLRTAKPVQMSRRRTATLAKRSFSVGAGQTAKVRLRLSRKGQRLVRRLGSVKVSLVADVTDTAGNTGTSKRTTILRNS